MSSRKRTEKKTVGLYEITTVSSRKRTEKKTVGLYEITRTSEPISIPDLASRVSSGETVTIVDEPLPRVTEWLNNIFANIGAIRSDSKQPDSVKAFAERCFIPAARLFILLRDMRQDSNHSAQFVAQAIEIAAELAEEWQSLQMNATLEKPVTKYLSSNAARAANVTASNAKKNAEAVKGARDKFDAWRNDPKRRHLLANLNLDECLQMYVKRGRPTRRDVNRLSALLKDGKMK